MTTFGIVAAVVAFIGAIIGILKVFTTIAYSNGEMMNKIANIQDSLADIKGMIKDNDLRTTQEFDAYYKDISALREEHRKFDTRLTILEANHKSNHPT